MSVYRWIISLLVWMSAEPDAAEYEAPRASAAVSYAYATIEHPLDHPKSSGKQSDR
jgi:hypothetical protein